MPRTGTILFFAVISLAINASALPTRQRITELLDSSSYEALSKELRRAEANDPLAFAGNKYGYLLARVEEKRGDYAFAAKHFHATAVLDPDLKPYALKHLAQILRFSGNLAFERLILNEIAYREPDGLLSAPARSRLLRNYYESADYSTVIDKIENGFQGAEEDSLEVEGRETQLLLGTAYLRSRMPAKARGVFYDLIASGPELDQPDDFDLEAAKGLDRLDVGSSGLGVRVAHNSAGEHAKRARIYQFNRNFHLARLHYSAIIENHQEDKAAPEAMYQIALGYDQERDYRKSLEWYRKLLDRYPDDNLKALALYGSAGALANLNDTANAVAAYRKYIEQNPEADNLERAYLNIVDAYRDAGDNARALEWSGKIRELFRGGMGEAVALFCEARIHISESEWERALTALERLREMRDLGGRIAGGTNRAEVDFQTAFVLEKIGRIADAVNIYLRIHDGRGEYYGWRATERLRLLAAIPANKAIFRTKLEKLENERDKLSGDMLRVAEQDILRLKQDTTEKAVRAIYRDLEDYSQVTGFVPVRPSVSKRAQKLLDIGIYDEAAPEIEVSLRKRNGIAGEGLSGFEDTSAFSLSVMHVKGGFADRAIRLIEPKWEKIPDDYQIELIPREQALLLYPAPFRDELLRYGKSENVDPRFLLAIMRQESRFQTDVKSAAAARGLMQFISGTSRKIAEELMFEPYSNEQLYDPDTAIRFGSKYLANLFKEFPGQSQAVAASYNAGEDRMARWQKRSKTSDPDIYVPEIVFRQTKQYVYSVMANYRMYKHLYDENLAAKRKDDGG